MRILVIGGTRFMGPYVIAGLVRDGHDVTAFHRGPGTGNLPNGVNHIFGNRHNLRDHASAIRAVDADVVLDMMLITEANALDLLGVLQGSNARIVAASSCDVYRNYGGLIGKPEEEPDATPLTEGSPLRSRLYPYRGETPRASDDPSGAMDDYDTILVERALQSQTDHAVTKLRLPMVHGPGDYQHRLAAYLKQMDAGSPAIALSPGLMGFRAARAYVENAAHAIALAVTDERAAGGVYNVADEPTLDEAGWVRAVGTAAGWHGEVTVGTEEDAPGDDADYRYDLDVDASRIRRELGYAAPLSFEEGLARTIAWERESTESGHA